MDDDESNELIVTSDDDSSASDSEDIYLNPDKPPQPSLQPSKTEFVLILLLLIVSSLATIIVLPLYLDAINVRSDAYNLLLFASVFVGALLFAIRSVNHALYPATPTNESSHEQFAIMQLGGTLTIAGFLIVYGMDRKKVMCHIQDPLKGIAAVFSLIYYFFFCKKLMRLQAIFSATTVIIGLFISIDYGLCDKFRCRGLEFENPIEDTGLWSWQTHVGWTVAYIGGLAIFAGFYMMLERHLVVPDGAGSTVRSSFLLSTVSRLVDNRDQAHSSGRPGMTEVVAKKSQSTVDLACSIQMAVFILTVALAFTNLIPGVGQVSTMGQFVNHSMAVFCSFGVGEADATAHCGHLLVLTCLFVLFYTLFLLSSIHFLLLSQSAVFTVATAVSALPLVSLWWSLFRIEESSPGFVVWAPSVAGEFICAVLGLPIVIIGLVFLCKSHFRDCALVSDQLRTRNTQAA